MREADGWRVESLDLDEVQSSSRAAEFLARRLEMLPPNALRLLSTGAVLGKEFELDVAAELSRQTPGQSIMALDVARQRRLVWLRPDGSRCVFVHDKIRSAVLDGQAATDRRRLHGQAAAYLQSHHDDRSTEIAYHFDAAGDSQFALPYALKAATQARTIRVGSCRAAIPDRGARRKPPTVRCATAWPRSLAAC